MAAGLAACGTSWVSKGLTDVGRVGEVVFPDIRKDAWQREGTHADAATLRRIVPGTSKDQLLADGPADARFRQPGDGAVATDR